MRYRRQVTGMEYGKSHYPAYDSAELGFRGYWYPVSFSRRLQQTPVAITLLGEELCLARDVDGTAYCVSDRCPHRGIPLSEGQQEFPGTITCPYHGFTYALRSGELVGVLTDGPDSPLCGKLRVRTYPVEERAGLVWVYIGDDTPRPVEADIPQEFLHKHALVLGRLTEREGDWRHAAENGFDEGHAKYLHRSSLFLFFRRVPAWSRTRVVTDNNGVWISRVHDQIGWETDYPGLGRWPRFRFWHRRGAGPRTSIRLPGLLQVTYPDWVDFEWYIPTVAGRHLYVQIAVAHRAGLGGLLYRLKYWTYLRPIFHGQFNDQDAWMVRLMRTPPERLYRPDVSIIAWRKLAETARALQTEGPAAAMRMPQITTEDDVREESRA